MTLEVFEKIQSKIFAELKKDPVAVGRYKDLLAAAKSCDDKKAGSRALTAGLEMLSANMAQGDVIALFPVYKEMLLANAPYHFDSYLIYLEIKRAAPERFYLPRRRVMKVLVDAMQELADDELDELFLSMPPRVGKTTILMLYVTWIIGRNSEASNLYSAFSDIITKAFYNGVLEILNDPDTYTWGEIFPDAKIVATNSQDETINIDRKKRYPSITCRSIASTLNGACDCNGILISDDLVSGIEEAMNKDRMIALWGKVDNNLLPRAKEKAKVLWCGTRWSIIDPAGIRMELLQNDERFRNRRFRIINLPAMDDNDESNFEYLYNVGFSTDYYRQRRASFERNNDIASWTAQYMGEPIEREGTLFAPTDFRYYNGTLPEVEPDRVFMAVDPAFGGGDFVAAPICYQYGTDIYVHDVVYSNDDKRVTQPMIAKAIQKYGVNAVLIEATKTTMPYKEGIDALLQERGVRVNMMTKAAPSNIAKDDRIFDKAPDIREFMVFREPGQRSRDYELFLQNVFAFKMYAKNKHDDAPDSLSMAIDMVLHPMAKVEVFKRFF